MARPSAFGHVSRRERGITPHMHVFCTHVTRPPPLRASSVRAVTPRQPLLRIAVLLAAALGLMGMAAATGSAAERDFSLRYSSNVNGQITIAANAIMQCPTNTVDPLMNSGCTGARAGTNDRNNNSFDMQWLDVDSDASTFTSSSSDLALPAGSRVLFAGLYWTGLNKKGEAISGANGFKAVPQNPPDAAAIGTVKVKAPGDSAYTTVTALAANVNTASIAVGGGYGAFADVTTLVKSAGAGTYTVADVQTGTGGNAYAGWSLVVAYSNPDEPLRNLSVFDGLKVVSGTQQIDIPLSGFKTPGQGAVNTTIGVVAAEGDAGATGDYLTVNDNRLTDAVHPPNNTENSTIANRGAQVTTKNPDWRNNLGYDASLFSADGFLGNGDTTAIFRAKTSGDTYAPQAITFATELFSPNVTLTKTSPSGQDFPGATKTYTITATNSGLANATNVTLEDIIPSGLAFRTSRSPQVTITSNDSTVATDSNATYDATTTTLSARLGAGATSTFGGTLGPGKWVTLVFEADIGPAQPLDKVLTNTATLGFVSPDLGLPISVVADDDTVIRYPDPGISKTLASSSGSQYTYELLVTNEGTVGTTGTVTLNDSVGPGTVVGSPGGSGWSCSVTGSAPSQSLSCTRNDTLAAGASYPPVSLTLSYGAGASVENTATLADGSGSEPTDPFSPARLNNSSTVTAGQAPLATLDLLKSALSGTISFGTSGGFRMEVRNTGPSAATNATLVDTLPAGLTYTSYTSTQGTCSPAPGAGGTTVVSCALGTLAANASATVIIRVLPDISLVGATATTVTNTATASSDVTPSPDTATATLTIRPGADLSLAKAVSAPTVAESGSVTYTLTATNNGPAAASNMRVVDRLPPAVNEASVTVNASDSGTCTTPASGVTTLTCSWGSVPSGATRTVTITAPIRAASDFTADAGKRKAVNRANVFSSTSDPDQSDNAAEATTIVTQAADLQVNASGPGAIAAGATGEVSFTTVNNGPSTASSPTLTVTIPAELTPISAPAGCAIAGQVVTCALPDMASGDVVNTTIGVRADPGLVEVSTTAGATVTSATPDYDEDNNRDVAPFVTGPVADLAITKSASAATVYGGGTVDWTITVRNNGPYSSNGSVVTDTLPAGLTPTSVSSSVPDACSIAGQVVTCRAGEIVPDDGYQALIVTTVDPDYAGATITNTATLTPGAEADPNAANNTGSASVRVNPGATGADLAITKTASATRVKPGGALGYQMVVTNTGGSVSTQGTVVDTLPQGVTPRTATINGQACGIRGRTVTCPVGFLPVDSSATVSIAATVGRDRAGATLLNTAQVTTGSETDPNARNNTARARTTVTVPRGTRARLAIRTRVGPAVARPGTSVLVSATVRTVSRYPSNTVRVCLTIPRGLAYKGSTGARSGRVVCWVRPQVRAGTPVTVRYRAVARRAGTVQVLGTAVAGNAARVSDRSSLPVLGVTG